MALTSEGIVNIPGLMSRWVRLGNGAMAHYMTAGDSGPSIILLHGGIVGSSGAAGWRFMATALAEAGFRVYCPDRPGFGLADTRERYWPKMGYFSWVEFVDQFADAVGLDKFFLAGNSQGAACTAYYVVNHPQRIERFALIATALFTQPFVLGVDQSKVKQGMGSGKFDGTPASMKALMEPIIFRKEAIDDALLEMRTRAANNQMDAYNAALKFNTEAPKDPNYAHLFNLKGRLDKLTIPGIYLFGRQDVLVPVENGYLQEGQLPNIQVFYPDQCGHQGQTDQPEMFNQVFIEFFKNGKVSRKTADWAGVSKRRPELTHLVEQSAVAAG
ncbi:MAG: alpha/beta hydrolase [SAR202 cluster bacterium]|nr:alpha/beta hydrolase [SAR202 cluster bacterium]